MIPKNENATLIYEQAWALVELKRPEEAIPLFLRAISLDPERVYMRCGLAAAYNEAGYFEESLATAEQAISLDPEEEWAHRQRSQALIDLGRADEGVEAAKEALRLEPDNPECVNQLFGAQLASRQLEQAAASGNRLLQLRPDDADTYASLALLCLKQGRPEKAEEYNLKALSIDPESSMALCNLGLSYDLQGRKMEALEHYYLALKLDPTSSTTLANLKIQVVECGFADLHDFLAARGDQELSQKVEKRSSLIQEASVWMDREQYKDAARVLELALNEFPYNMTVMNMLCRSYEHLHLHHKALPIADRMIKLHPQNPDGYRRRARALSKLSILTELVSIELKGQAIDAADTAFRLSNGDPSDADLLIAILTQAERFTEAERALNRLLRDKPDWWWAHYRAGWFWEERKLFEMAEGNYRQAMFLAPEESEPPNSLGRCLMALNRRREAQMYFNRAVRLAPDNKAYQKDLAKSMKTPQAPDPVKRIFNSLWRR